MTDQVTTAIPMVVNPAYRSEGLGKLAEALSKAQLEYKTIVRNKNNPFFKSKYAPLESVIEATSQSLANHGLAVTQTTGYHPDSHEFCLCTILMHSSGEYISGYMPLPKVNKPHELGAAITYYRRYALCAILNVNADDDDDGNAASSIDSSSSVSTTKKKTTRKVDVNDDTKRLERLERTRQLYNQIVGMGYEDSFPLSETSSMADIAQAYHTYKEWLQQNEEIVNV